MLTLSTARAEVVALAMVVRKPCQGQSGRGGRRTVAKSCRSFQSEAKIQNTSSDPPTTYAPTLRHDFEQKRGVGTRQRDGEGKIPGVGEKIHDYRLGMVTKFLIINVMTKTRFC